MGNFLTDLMSNKANSGSAGMAQKAGEALSVGAEYRKYVIEVQSNGEQPMSYEEFKASRA